MPDQGIGSNSNLSGVVATAANDVWAVGGVESETATNYSTLIEQWNGSVWSTMQSPNVSNAGNVLYGVTAVSASDVWAVGGTQYSSGSILGQPLTEHWNGTAWSIVSSPVPPEPTSNFFSVAAISSSDVWAVGYMAKNNIGNTLIEHWNGSSWAVATSPNPGSLSNGLNGIAAVPSGRYLVAVGSFSNNLTTNFRTLVVRHLQTLFSGGATSTTRRNGPGSAILCP